LTAEFIASDKSTFIYNCQAQVDEISQQQQHAFSTNMLRHTVVG